MYAEDWMPCPVAGCDVEWTLEVCRYTDERGRSVQVEVLEAPCGHEADAGETQEAYMDWRYPVMA